MGDEQHRHAIGLAQPIEQRENLRLHGHVERRRRLVGDEEIGLVGERHRDHHTLALASRELMWIGAEPLAWIGYAHLLEQLHDAVASRRLRAHPVQRQDFCDLALDDLQRIERGHRLLKHHRDARAAHTAQGGFVHLQHVLAAEIDDAGGMIGGRWQEPRHGERGDRLAGARIRRPARASCPCRQRARRGRRRASLCRPARRRRRGRGCRGGERS